MATVAAALSPLVAAATEEASAAAPAPATAVAAESAGSEGEGEPTDWLDRTRDAVRAGTVWLAREVDGWFGDKPFGEGRGVTDGRLEVHAAWRRDEGFDAALRFGAHFDLPNLRDRAFGFFGRDVERDIVTDRPDDVAPGQLLTQTRREELAFFAGIGLPLGDAFAVRAGVRGGLKPYAQVRYAQAWPLFERGRLAFRETLFWSLSDRFGSTTTLSVENPLSPALSVRWLSSGTISQDSEGFEWSSNAGLYRSFDGERMLSTELLIEGQTGGDVGVSDVGLRVRWLQPVHEDWLFGEFSVGHFWPREEGASERSQTWALGFALKMRF